MDWYSNAAGWIKSVDDVKRVAETQLTHIVVGSITVSPRDGNPEPRFWVAPDGSRAINALGLPNRGIPYYRDSLRKMREIANYHGKKLVVSIVGVQQDDWMILAERVAPWVDGIEINFGCPNMWSEGVRKPILSFDPDAVARAIEAVSEVSGHVWQSVKLSPFQGHELDTLLPQVMNVIKNAQNIKAIVTSNTEPGVVPPVVDGKPVISMPSGGGSGDYLRPIALANVRRIRKLAPDIPVIGVGGISNGKHVREYMEADCIGVQVGTHFFQANDGARALSEIFMNYAWEQAA